MVRSTSHPTVEYLKSSHASIVKMSEPVRDVTLYSKMDRERSVYLPNWKPQTSSPSHVVVVEVRTKGAYFVYVVRTSSERHYTVYYRRVQPHEVKLTADLERVIIGQGVLLPAYLLSYTKNKRDYEGLSSTTLSAPPSVWNRFRATEQESGTPKLLVAMRCVAYVVCLENCELQVFYYTPKACEIPPLGFFDKHAENLKTFSFK